MMADSDNAISFARDRGFGELESRIVRRGEAPVCGEFRNPRVLQVALDDGAKIVQFRLGDSSLSDSDNAISFARDRGFGELESRIVRRGEAPVCGEFRNPRVLQVALDDGAKIVQFRLGDSS